MRRLLALIVGIVVGQTVPSFAVDLPFYTYKVEGVPPTAMTLSRFSPDPSEPMVDPIAQTPSVDGNQPGDLDFSQDGRLFGSFGGGTIYELDPSNGTVLGSMLLESGFTKNNIEGIAAVNGSEVYVYHEDKTYIWRVDFDAGTKQLLVDFSFDLDELDFDLDGNLIALDQGKIYNVPLNGAPPVLVANQTLPASGSMSFSPLDGDMYVVAGTELWSMPWINGAPNGQFQLVKTIGPGPYYHGLTIVPEPNTLFFLASGAVLAFRRRRQAA